MQTSKKTRTRLSPADKLRIIAAEPMSGAERAELTQAVKTLGGITLIEITPEARAALERFISERPIHTDAEIASLAVMEWLSVLSSAESEHREIMQHDPTH